MIGCHLRKAPSTNRYRCSLVTSDAYKNFACNGAGFRIRDLLISLALLNAVIIFQVCALSTCYFVNVENRLMLQDNNFGCINVYLLHFARSHNVL